MKWVGLFVLLFLGNWAKAQSIDWYELVIINDLKSANFLVTSIDSLGQRCFDGKHYRYCTRAEEVHDLKLKTLLAEQKESLNSMDIKLKLIPEDSLVSTRFADRDKYRYIIDYDYDLIELEKPRSSVIYLKLDFLLIDRKTNRIIGRSHDSDIEDPFEPLKLMIDELIQLRAEE